MSQPDRDPFELLQKLNPLSPEALEREASDGADARVEALLARAAAEGAASPRWRPRRLGELLLPRGRSLGLAALGLAAAAAAALVAWLALPAAGPGQVAVSCFERPSLSAASLNIHASPGAAASACQRALGRGGQRTLPLATLRPCLLADGRLAVFPSRSKDICGSLGLRSAGNRR